MSREAYVAPTLQPQTTTLSEPTIQYLCGECNAKVQLKKGDPIRCKDCGHRVLYKERTKRYVGLLVFHTLWYQASSPRSLKGWCNSRRDSETGELQQLARSLEFEKRERRRCQLNLRRYHAGICAEYWTQEAAKILAEEPDRLLRAYIVSVEGASEIGTKYPLLDEE